MDGEQRYIYIGDLKTITHAITILYDIVEDNNPLIDNDEILDVRIKLRNWQRAHFNLNLTDGSV